MNLLLQKKRTTITPATAAADRQLVSCVLIIVLCFVVLVEVVLVVVVLFVSRFYARHSGVFMCEFRLRAFFALIPAALCFDFAIFDRKSIICDCHNEKRKNKYVKTVSVDGVSDGF